MSQNYDIILFSLSHINHSECVEPPVDIASFSSTKAMYFIRHSCRASTRLSTASLHDTSAAAEAASIEVAEAAEADLPLQRRNSIHNVPYVDVNDPETRARMERYKEERRDDGIQ